MPFRAEGQQFAQGVGTVDVFELVAAGQTQFVGQRRVERDVVEQPDVLPRRRQFGFPAITVALRVDPVARPVGLDARADVGRITEAQAHGAWLAGVEFDVHRDHVIFRGGRCGIDAHAFEIAARLQIAVEFGDQFGVVRLAFLERHHALQQIFVERRVAFESDFAQRITRAAVVDQFDVGDPGARVDHEFLAGEVATEKTEARGLILDQSLGVFVTAMVEHRAGLERVAFRHTKGFEGGSRAVDTDGDVAQVNRLAGIDVQHQARFVAALDVAVDLRLVVAQRLGRLARLLFGTATEAQQGFFVTIAEAADIAFYIGLEFIVGRFDPHIQFTLRQCRAAG